MESLFAYFDLHLVYLLVFSIALAYGAGASFLGGIQIISALKDGKLSPIERTMIARTRTVMLVSFLLYGFSGIGLFTISYESMVALDIFWASQTVVGILFLNVVTYYVFVRTRFVSGVDYIRTPNIYVWMILSEICTMVSWLFLVAHHALYQFPVSYSGYMTVYFLIQSIFFGYIALSIRNKISARVWVKIKYTEIVLVSIAFIFLIMTYTYGIMSVPKEEPNTQTVETGTTFSEKNQKHDIHTPADVALHNTVEDCWVIIDIGIYDAGDAVTLYPDIYTCGANVTTQYRTIVSEGISERMQKKQVGVVGYSIEEVAKHATKKDCWLNIDEYVFDASKEATLHPAAFNCGTDASINYHKNHGENISERMMRSVIGYIDESEVGDEVKNDDIKNDQLRPYTELYLKSWDPHELMVVVEKDVEKLLFIDGKTHTPVGRIHDIGYQPHTSVYSHDAKYMFIIARDGWLTKIDLTTLEPIKSVKVGTNSRGTALTDSGKYLVIGNYEPKNAVIINPETLDIIKTIPTKGILNRVDVESRVGAVVEDGEMIILALKDLNSVWVIDTAKPDFPIVHQFANIGGNKTPLHDAFLTPDGRFYLVASMGSHTVWILDTDTWIPVGEIPSGNTPHTGPGATWGPYIYVPSLGEGSILVIDSRTWKEVTRIKTAGPGLFVRSYTHNPSYPYVWAETAFGEHHDEIYVIDAKTQTIHKTLVPIKGESSWHPEFTRDGKFVYVVSQTGNKVIVYDSYTFEVVKRIESETPSAISNVGLRIEEPGL